MGICFCSASPPPTTARQHPHTCRRPSWNDTDACNPEPVSPATYLDLSAYSHKHTAQHSTTSKSTFEKQNDPREARRKTTGQWQKPPAWRRQWYFLSSCFGQGNICLYFVVVSANCVTVVTSNMRCCFLKFIRWNRGDDSLGKILSEQA